MQHNFESRMHMTCSWRGIAVAVGRGLNAPRTLIGRTHTRHLLSRLSVCVSARCMGHTVEASVCAFIRVACWCADAAQALERKEGRCNLVRQLLLRRGQIKPGRRPALRQRGGDYGNEKTKRELIPVRYTLWDGARAAGLACRWHVWWGWGGGGTCATSRCGPPNARLGGCHAPGRFAVTGCCA